MTATGESNLQDFKTNPAAGPVRWALDLFSSVWLGVWLLAFLFVYSSVGSVGVWVPGAFTPLIVQHDWIHEIYWFIPWTQMHIRQAPGMEMTEFEWFHWWPFNLNIALICVNLVVATLRRIPFNVINLGVWMIHTGIIILAIGSVMYFSTKLEGDAPILRREIHINVPGAQATLPAQPGARKEIEADNGRYLLRVMNIDPDWELLSGEDEGKRAYAIFVAVQSPEHQFVRQLIANYPEYTEDTIWTDDERRMVRAVREIGRPLVDDSIELSLDYLPQEHFYLMDSTALYLREKGEREWIERPIRNLPRYNDYLVSPDDVWHDQAGSFRGRISPLEIAVEAHEENDPLAETPIVIRRYIRYGTLETRRLPGGVELDPVVALRLRDDAGVTEEYRMVAFDPNTNLKAGGRLQFIWAESEERFQQLTDVRPARLTFRVPEHDVEVEVDAQPPAGPAAGEFVPIEDTPFAYRIEAIERLGDAMAAGVEGPVNVAIVQIRTPERTFRRWVFDRPEIPTRDFAPNGQAAMHTDMIELDERIVTRFDMGSQGAPVTIVAGPDDDDLHLLLTLPGREPSVERLMPGRAVRIGQTITMEVQAYAARTISERRPTIVPPHQRQRNDRQQRSLINVHLPIEGGQNLWLPYHLYPFESEREVLRRFPYRPMEVELSDGRVVELIFSRERRPLPARIALDEFVLSEHIGGFTGQTATIRDWMSVVRFETENGWSEPEPISMNKPAAHGGFWYFQSQWDPPDQMRFEGDVASRGLNFTVLGVGNRNGVWTQLFGSCVAVIGMIYAFYVKPLLKRRRQEQVYAQVRSAKVENEAA